MTSGCTEISGESGAGKTQICIQLALTVQLAHHDGGLSKGAVFICTEHNFVAHRCGEIKNSLIKKYPIYNRLDFLKNIYTRFISTWVIKLHISKINN